MGNGEVITEAVWETIVCGAQVGAVSLKQPISTVKAEAIRWLFGLTAAVEKELQPPAPEPPPQE